jgi:hypothetical protein
MPSLPLLKQGTYTGTTAALTVQVGFRPDWIKAWNQTDGDTYYWWSSKMSGTVVCLITTAAASQSSTITLTDHGFILPASDAVINENGKVYVYECGKDN